MPSYVEAFYARHPGLRQESFAEQKKRFDYDHFAWADALDEPMARLGYEIFNSDLAIEPMLQAWARENMASSPEYSASEILVEQAKRFKPDILMFDCVDRRLLKILRSSVGTIRVIFGWSGSAIGRGGVWDDMDLVLSCAPESVDELRRLGHHSEHLNHAFDPRINDRLMATKELIPISFIGSIVRRSTFHLQREEILLNVAKTLPLQIYSPNISAEPRDYLKAVVSGGIHAFSKALEYLYLLQAVKRGSPFVEKWLRVGSPPRLPISPKLAKRLRPGVYGLAYYQLMLDSAVSLNIHADSSPKFASNIRLFEATGVGSCLLTDWRDNLGELFDADREVVAYRSASECVEKAKWLLENPKARAEIAERGRDRIQRCHTFAHRSAELDAILRRYLAKNMVAGR